MGGHLKPIGGEQWFDIELFDNTLDNFKDTTAVFLRGGQSSIRFIVEDIEIKPYEYILMPSFLCPTILHNFDRFNIKYEFYKINKDLSIDLDDIEEKVSKLKPKAVLFINYFGFYHNLQTLKYFNELKNQKIIIIEDAVQMLWVDRKKFVGDYVFNSYRKFLPIDGSIVLCNKRREFSSIKDNYYNNVNLARAKKTMFQTFHIGKEVDFLELYEKAEEDYYKAEAIIGMDSQSRKMLSKVNCDVIAEIRKKNYEYLFDKLEKKSEIQIFFNKNLIQDNIILTFPILIENRNEVRKKLRDVNIYCPVHWDILNEKWSYNYDESKYISKRILSLPIDQRYDFKDLDRLIECLLNLVGGDKD
ncbi:DegT/DnrJ/EryC1/StrS aminotransferase family protein [Clostridium beijerinckii]|uniref:DegT/DnrJ/EryC1/StrS aminotransferase family protein n=1 Tax=Clostridium beijerinckii TaxID=1520 RepID=UPI00031B1D82|nr:DegT/DnrJ/EryC1/StrS aminotransferase family protein [Clostridium beijerinckii]